MSPVLPPLPNIFSEPEPSRQSAGRAREKAQKLKELRCKLRELEPGRPGVAGKAENGKKESPLGLFRPLPDSLGPNILRLDPDRLGGLHDISGACYGDVPAAIGFCRALLAAAARAPASRKTVLWAQTGRQAGEFGQLYSPALWQDGLDPGHLLFLTASTDTDILWAMEEGLKSNALLAVVGEVSKTGFTATRRLALASARSLTPGFLIRPDDRGASAAVTRWRVGALPSAPNDWHEKAPGNPRWHLELVRNRGGRPCSFNLEWSHETHTFRLAAAAAHRPSQTKTPYTNEERGNIPPRRHLA